MATKIAEYVTWQDVKNAKSIAEIKQLAELQVEAVQNLHQHPESIESVKVLRVWEKGGKYSERGKEKTHATSGFAIRVAYRFDSKKNKSGVRQKVKDYCTRAF